MPKKNGKVKLQRFNFRLQRLIIGNLKGIKNFTLTFDPEKRVTAIVGVNGSGKSTIIHALACAFKPKGNETSKDFNRLSHFFTPNKDSTWDGSKFLVDFSYSEFNPMHRELGAIEVHRSELFIKSPVPSKVVGYQYMLVDMKENLPILACKIYQLLVRIRMPVDIENMRLKH